MGEEFFVRVETGKLKQAALEIEEKLNQLQAAFAGMDEVMERTQGYWLGEAGDTHRKVFWEQQPKREETIKRLQVHIRDLQKMAGIYDTAEQEAVNTAESLPEDVII